MLACNWLPKTAILTPFESISGSLKLVFAFACNFELSSADGQVLAVIVRDSDSFLGRFLTSSLSHVGVEAHQVALDQRQDFDLSLRVTLVFIGLALRGRSVRSSLLNLLLPFRKLLAGHRASRVRLVLIESDVIAQSRGRVLVPVLLVDRCVILRSSNLLSCIGSSDHCFRDSGE